MEGKLLAYRMYFFVPYNISPIQQAIQAGHAALEYAYKYGDNKEYKSFIENDKTWIILNGGTTNEMLDADGCYYGTLNQLMVQLSPAANDYKIPYAYFREPDLNNALTAFCFLADERVWDYKTYQEFFDFVIGKMYPAAVEAMPPQNYLMLKRQSLENLKGMFPEYYNEWVEFLGGEKNLFLRELLKGKKLA